MNHALDYLLVLLSDLHVGTGIPGGGFDDRVARDAAGTPIVPATAIKGAIRDALVAAGVPSDALTRPFGKEDGDGGVVWFSDAECLDCTVGSRSHVALGEGRTTRRGSLVEIETIQRLVRKGTNWHPVVFRGYIDFLPGIPPDAKSLDLVAKGLARLDTLGARTRRGYGRIAVAILHEGQAA